MQKIQWTEVIKLGFMITGGIVLVLAGQPAIGSILIGSAVGSATPGNPFAVRKDDAK